MEKSAQPERAAMEKLNKQSRGNAVLKGRVLWEMGAVENIAGLAG